jgi:cysteine desulfurase/selenocysteine lyase
MSAADGMTKPFDPAALRAEFPILSRTVHKNVPLIYLDSAASAQKPEAVIEAMAHVMRHSYANVHRGLHTLANEVTGKFESARETVARFLNAASHEEIVFTKSATEAINLVAATVGQSLREGDEILITQMEHHANIVPWHFLRERKGVVLKWAPIREDGSLDLDALHGMISERTKIVAVSHMSNVLGTVNPVKEIVEAAKDAGALTLIDGCQSAVHLPIDVQALGCDFFVFSAHKVYGPTGIGVLYGRASVLAGLPPYQGGGEMIGEVHEDRITYADPPHRFEAGTPAIIEAVGLEAALHWLSRYDRHSLLAHEEKLYRRAADALAGLNWVKVHGTAEGKGAILSFSVDGAHPHDVAQILDRRGVAVRAGHHCAQPLMRRLGVSATARASFSIYNTEQEVDAFVDALLAARKILQ